MDEVTGLMKSVCGVAEPPVKYFDFQSRALSLLFQQPTITARKTVWDLSPQKFSVAPHCFSKQNAYFWTWHSFSEYFLSRTMCQALDWVLGIPNGVPVFTGLTFW